MMDIVFVVFVDGTIPLEILLNTILICIASSVDENKKDWFIFFLNSLIFRGHT